MQDCLFEDEDSTLAIIDKAAGWALGQTDLHARVKPLAEHFTHKAQLDTVTEAMFTEVLLAVAKALETGIYLGKFGFPDEQTPIPIPEYLEKAFKPMEDEHSG